MKVAHVFDEWADRVTNASTNGTSGLWAQLKRSINGTETRVWGKHLWKYAKEAEYRFNRPH